MSKLNCSHLKLQCSHQNYNAHTKTTVSIEQLQRSYQNASVCITVLPKRRNRWLLPTVQIRGTRGVGYTIVVSLPHSLLLLLLFLFLLLFLVLLQLFPALLPSYSRIHPALLFCFPAARSTKPYGGCRLARRVPVTLFQQVVHGGDALLLGDDLWPQLETTKQNMHSTPTRHGNRGDALRLCDTIVTSVGNSRNGRVD